jgi:hypothetical protein
MLVAAASVTLSMIAVRALATMNYGRRSHEVLVDVPGAHNGIVERRTRYLRALTSRTSAWRGQLHSDGEPVKVVML